jgi:hypothetical protein
MSLAFHQPSIPAWKSCRSDALKAHLGYYIVGGK